jgi:hypothetical protein
VAVFALAHSPSVGRATWQPVAALLRDAGQQALVPSLLGVGDGPPPYWRDGYEEPAGLARSPGWPVRTVPGEHPHQVADPGAVTPALLDLAGQPLT